MTPLPFVFFGTDDFSVSILEELKAAGFLPALIVTLPDRPKGRGLVLTPPPSKVWAQQNDIQVMQPEKLDADFNFQLKTSNFALFIVASYGLILPKSVLDIPKHGTLNVHPSLLPKYRGATPIESQVVNDEKEIGVSIMLMDEELDHGPLVAQKKIHDLGFTIQEYPKASALRKVLAEEGGKLLAEILPKWMNGEIEAKSQDDSKATFTKKLVKADGEIDLAGDARQNFLKIQAFDGSIGTYFFMSADSPFSKGSTREGEGFKSSVLEDSDTSFRKGGMQNKQIRVNIKSAELKDGKLILTRVVPEGKKEMSYEEFLRGMR